MILYQGVIGKRLIFRQWKKVDFPVHSSVSGSTYGLLQICERSDWEEGCYLS